MRQGTVIRAFIVLAIIGVVVQAFTIIEGARLIDALHARQLTQCQFNNDLGNLAKVKVIVSPATHKAAKVGIAIIADSRSAFRGLGCPGRLDKPGPSFVHWAKAYGLPFN